MRGPRACVRALATCFLSSRFHRPVLPQVLRLAIAQPVAGIDAHASMIIAVPAPVGGLVVLARTSVAYVPTDALSGVVRRGGSGTAAVEALTVAPLMPSAWARVDATRYLVADAGGGLFLLELLLAGETEAATATAPAARRAPTATAPASTAAAVAAKCAQTPAGAGDANSAPEGLWEPPGYRGSLQSGWSIWRLLCRGSL